MYIKKGDTIQVIAGKDKGRSGKVVRALPSTDQVVVEGVNKRFKHQRSTRGGQKGQIIEKDMPLHVSNVALLDPKTGKPTRVGIVKEDGKRVRIARPSGNRID